VIPLHASTVSLNELFVLPSKDYIAMFKELLQDSFDKESVVFTADARNATYLALKVMGLQKNDEVLVPGYGCDAIRVAVEPICKPVYVDIDQRTFNIDPEEIEKHITKNTRAILITNLYGNPSDMERVIEIARTYNLKVIEDITQALGGSFHDRALGSFGDFTVFSFRFSKDITSLRGGALLANEKLDLHLQPISSLRVFPPLFTIILALNQIKNIPAFIYSPVRKHILFPFFRQGADKFNASNETLSNYQCYLLYQQFAKMRRIIEKRGQNAAYYSEKLRDAITTPVETDKGSHIYFRYAIQIDNRDELFDYLSKHGIEADKTYDHCLAPEGVCPKSEAVSKRNLHIPVHHELSSNDLERVVKAVYNFKGMK